MALAAWRVCVRLWRVQGKTHKNITVDARTVFKNEKEILRMKRTFIIVAAVAALSVPQLGMSADPKTMKEYCIYLQSHVTGKEKPHTCRRFQSYAECQKAAKRIDGRCDYKKK